MLQLEPKFDDDFELKKQMCPSVCLAGTKHRTLDTVRKVPTLLLTQNLLTDYYP